MLGDSPLKCNENGAQRQPGDQFIKPDNLARRPGVLCAEIFRHDGVNLCRSQWRGWRSVCAPLAAGVWLPFFRFIV